MYQVGLLLSQCARRLALRITSNLVNGPASPFCPSDSVGPLSLTLDIVFVCAFALPVTSPFAVFTHVRLLVHLRVVLSTSSSHYILLSS